MTAISTLSDDFTGTTLNTTNWSTTVSNGSVSLANNSLANLTVNGVNGAASIVSATGFSLQNSSIYFKPVIPTAVLTDPAAGTLFFYLAYQNQTAATIQIVCGTSPTLFVDIVRDLGTGTSNRIYSGTYDPTASAYLRLRATGNTSTGLLYFGRSPDASTWTETTAANITIWASTSANNIVTQIQYAGTANSTSRTVSIDSVNALGTYTGYPLIETLVDDFPGTTLDTTKWALYNNGTNGGIVTVSGGTANISIATSGNNSGLKSVATYQIAGSYIYVKPTIDANLGNSFFIQLFPLTGSGYCSVQLTRNGNVIVNLYSSSGGIYLSNYSIFTYNPATMVYFRLRFQLDGQAFLAYSTNATAWSETPLAATDWTGNPAASLSKLYLFANTGGNGSIGNSTATIDNVNTNVANAYAATASPTGVNDAETLGAPTAPAPVVNTTASPTGVNDADTVTGPTTGTTRLPTGINDPETVTGPSLTIALAYQPTGVNDIQTLGTPSASYAFSASPSGVSDPDALDPGNQLYGNAYNNGLYGAGVYGQTPAPYPAGASDPETVTGPSITTAYTLAPTGINDAQSLAQPAVPIPDVLQPAGLGDPETISGPTLMGPPMSVAPGSVNDADSATAPATAAAQGSMIYGGGVYGDGLYSGWVTSPSTAYPNALSDAETLGVTTSGGDYGTGAPVVGTPANNGYGSGTYGTGLYNTNPATSVSPTSIGDPETLDGVGGTIPVVGTNNTLGSGVYGTGVYGGPAATVPVSTNDSTIYGAGDYGAGIYYGQSASTTPDNTPAVPLFPASLSSVPLVPMHLLGIGPWSPYVMWGGVSNRGVIRSLKPAKPIIVMPPATALSITLRLVGGCEATADFSFPRGRAVIIEEMHTDLWWRRKDPYTGRLEVLGRFNAGTNDLSSDGEQISSSVHFVDYETLLSERMLLKYKDTYTTSAVVSGKTEVTEHQQTQWPLGTKVTDILRFCIPTNMGLDLGVLAADADTDLGVIRVPWSTPPDATMADIFTNVLAVSSKQWEWWVQQPADVGLAPVLRFIVGTRGSDNGVVLFDIGAGPSPIASWNMTAATSTYANALYFEGGKGGVVVTNAEQITEYGQRDAHDGDSTLNGALAPIVFAADKKLNELADRRPTFSVVLKPGFWQGRSHIDIGDDVRLYIRLGSEVLDYRYRVTELALAIDQDGTETVTLTLGTPLSSADPRSRRSPILRVVRKLLNYAAPPHSNDQGAYDPTI